MTGTEFRTLHGDPATWTTTDIESQQNLAACDALPVHLQETPAEPTTPTAA